MFARMLLFVFVVAGFCGCGEPNHGSCFHRESGIMTADWKRDVVLEKIKKVRSTILRDNFDHLTALVEASDSRNKNRSWQFPPVPPTKDSDFESAYTERMLHIADTVGEKDQAFVFGKMVRDAIERLDHLSGRVRAKDENCSKCVIMEAEEIVARVHK